MFHVPATSGGMTFPAITSDGQRKTGRFVCRTFGIGRLGIVAPNPTAAAPVPVVPAVLESVLYSGCCSSCGRIIAAHPQRLPLFRSLIHPGGSVRLVSW